jgi:uncharacterized protein
MPISERQVPLSVFPQCPIPSPQCLLPMIIGILQFELLLRGATSLKDKRSVVSSLKDRLHREHQAAVAEVALHDRIGVARLGLAVVGSDGKHIGQTLDRITLKLRALHDAQLGDTRREVLHDPQMSAEDETEASGHAELPPIPPLEAESLATDMLASLDLSSPELADLTGHLPPPKSTQPEARGGDRP